MADWRARGEGYSLKDDGRTWEWEFLEGEFGFQPEDGMGYGLMARSKERPEQGLSVSLADGTVYLDPPQASNDLVGWSSEVPEAVRAAVIETLEHGFAEAVAEYRRGEEE